MDHARADREHGSWWGGGRGAERPSSPGSPSGLEHQPGLGVLPGRERFHRTPAPLGNRGTQMTAWTSPRPQKCSNLPPPSRPQEGPTAASRVSHGPRGLQAPPLRSEFIKSPVVGHAPPREHPIGARGLLRPAQPPAHLLPRRAGARSGYKDQRSPRSAAGASQFPLAGGLGQLNRGPRQGHERGAVEPRWPLISSSRRVCLRGPPGPCLWASDPTFPARASLLVLGLGKELGSERARGFPEVTLLVCG